MNLNQASDLLVDMYETGITVELVGPPGIGKTDIINATGLRISEKFGEPFGMEIRHVSTLESPDVAGFMIPSKDAQGNPVSRFTRSPILPDLDCPERGAVFLDERGQASVDVQKPLARFMLERRIGEHALKPKWVIWSARNRTSDRSGVVKDLRFLTNRMMQVQVNADPECWFLWAQEHDVHPLTIAFARWKPSVVFRNEIPEGDGPFCTPRTLVMADKAMQAIKNQSVVLEALQGLLGDGTAMELVKFYRVESELPTPAEIIANPKTAKIPHDDRPDAQFAAVQMVAHHATNKNIEKMMEYLFRFPQEFQLVGIRVIGKRVSNLMANPLFSQWVMASKGLITTALRQ